MTMVKTHTQRHRIALSSFWLLPVDLIASPNERRRIGETDTMTLEEERDNRSPMTWVRLADRARVIMMEE
jgi:hypothetical protein